MFDVAIIGSGPSGSMLARLMADRGHSVVLFEEHGSPGDPVNCSGVIGAEAFQRYDLPRKPILRQIDSFRFCSPSGYTLDYCHPEPLAVAVNRSDFDMEMAASAVSAGATLLTDSRVTQIRLENDAVHLSVNGEGSAVKSKFVVIATGAGSKLSEQVGLGKPKKYVLGAQTECDIAGLDQVEIHLGQNVAKSNFAWIIPLQRTRAKIGLISRKHATNSLKTFLHNLYLDGRISSEHHAIRCSLLPIDVIDQSYTDRTIVIGEAAGQIKTITCGGIYYGLRAAEIGAEVLHRALETGRYDASALSLYEKRWKALLGKELRMGSRLRSIFEHVSDQKLDVLFEIAGRNGLMKMICEKVNFDWHYDLVSSVLKHHMVRAIFQPSSYSKLFS